MRLKSPKLGAGAAPRSVVACVLLLVIAGTAFAEPGLSPSERQQARALFSVVISVYSAVVLAISFLIGRFAFKLTWRRPAFYVVSLVVAAGLVLISWVTGLLPLLIIFSALAGAGRTM